MKTIDPQWPYLVNLDGLIALQLPGTRGTEEVGESCGEWGSWIDENGNPAGVRLMFLPERFLQDSNIVRAKNVKIENGELIISFTMIGYRKKS